MSTAKLVTPQKPALLPKPGSVKVVHALYSYKARTVDELSFEEGDILYVFEQSKDGWWRAKCDGKVGLIPHNYVAEGGEVKEPLHDAVRRGNVTFLNECLGQGVSTTSLDAMGNTALYWAAFSGHQQCLEILLAQPAPPVNAQNHHGDSPLHAAASRNHLSTVQTLIEKGARTDIRNKNGETPEDLTMDSSIKNFLQLSRPTRNSCLASFEPEEYEDDSDH